LYNKNIKGKNNHKTGDVYVVIFLCFNFDIDWNNIFKNRYKLEKNRAK
jgi:hypothetical protein